MSERNQIEARLSQLQAQANTLSQRWQRVQLEIVKLTGVLEYLDAQSGQSAPAKLKAVPTSEPAQ